MTLNKNKFSLESNPLYVGLQSKNPQNLISTPNSRQ